jgi:hypothetical protein
MHNGHMNKYIALLLVLLSGCATCRDHPVACTAVGILAAGAVVASSQSNSTSQPATAYPAYHNH